MRVLTNIDYVGRGLFEPRHEERDRLCPDCEGEGITGRDENGETIQCKTCDGYGSVYPDHDEERD